MSELKNDVLAASAVMDRLPGEMVWEAGKVYLLRGHESGFMSRARRRRVLIVTTKLRAEQPIGGIILKQEDDELSEDEFQTWNADGAFSRERRDSTQSLDLTHDEVAL